MNLKFLFLLTCLISSPIFSAEVSTILTPAQIEEDGHYQKLILTSDEFQDGVVDDFFALMGMSGGKINGESRKFFPLSLIQGFAKPNPVSFRQKVTLHFKDNEVMFSKLGIFIIGSTAQFIYDLLENNFFNVEVETIIGKKGYTHSYKHISCRDGFDFQQQKSAITCNLSLEANETI